MLISAPGVKQDDLTVSTEHGLLAVRGESRVGRQIYKVDRLYEIPRDADVDHATAEHKDGVLTLIIPKRAPSERRSILIQTPQPTASAAAAPKARPDQRVHVPTPEAAASASTSVLSECEADENNVQRPEEKVEELAIGEAAAASAEGTHPQSYLAGYERALDDMDMDKMGTQATEARPAGMLPEDASTDVLPVVKDDWLAEWDEMLEDLNEMGFEDREANRMTLTKHAGSIKHAVKELLSSRRSREAKRD